MRSIPISISWRKCSLVRKFPLPFTRHLSPTSSIIIMMTSGVEPLKYIITRRIPFTGY